MTDGNKLLLTFDSIHDVLRTEKTLKTHGIFCDLVPTPKDISADCGMSVVCAAADLPRLEALRLTDGLEWRACYPR